MSISLGSIDCPHLTTDCLKDFIEQYSIHTTNQFLLWLNKSPDKIDKTIECIHSCVLAHTAQLEARRLKAVHFYRVNSFVFDQTHLLRSTRHLVFIYEHFQQKQWNDFFNFFLLRLFITNQPIKVQYLNTNPSLFDLNYFYHHYCASHEKICAQRNDLFDQSFYFQPCRTLEAFENHLNFMENNQQEIQIFIIDDLFSLIQPYLHLDRRIKSKVLQLTYRLNRLAQKQSILIISGLILHTTKHQRSSIEDARFDAFHADKYVLFQSVPTPNKDIQVEVLNEKTKDKQSIEFKLNLDEWGRCVDICS
ncbi:unnamed protein product [Adineta ricciae]|uniref:Uncharacterized protein n=1 Tax=Adineta ricciae TaxID=249248 RepID=A0A814KCJ6_ADIRI|nr:unnamed protein product [Adineta ricciae]